MSLREQGLLVKDCGPSYLSLSSGLESPGNLGGSETIGRLEFGEGRELNGDVIPQIPPPSRGNNLCDLESSCNSR